MIDTLIAVVIATSVIVISTAVAVAFSNSNYRRTYSRKPYRPGMGVPRKSVQYLSTKKIDNKTLNKTPTRKTIRKDSKDIKAILNSIWRVLKEIADFNNKQAAIILDDCDTLKLYLEKRTLSKMDISLINKKGSKVNVSVLKDRGLKTIFDLANFNNQKYEIIAGIGEKSAKKIRNNLRVIYEEVERNTVVRLSYDDRNEITSELVTSIAIYLGAAPYVDKAKELLSLKTQVDDCFKEYNRSINSPLVLFKPQEAFERAESAYLNLLDIIENNFENINNDLIIPFNKVKEKNSDDAWKDFLANPIEFNKVIEKIFKPSNLIQTAEYGLDSEIAKKVKNTPLNLNGLKLGLRTYQEWGTKYILCQKKSIIGDEMGLGKTAEAIAAMVDLYNNGCKHFMVICPLSVLTNWCREIYKFSSLSYYRMYGSGKDNKFFSWVKNGGVAVTTYESLNSLPITNEYVVNLLVVDEAHYIKNVLTLRTNNTKTVIRKSERVTFLTGTVLENKVDEMIRLIRYINPEVATKASESVSDYVDSNEFKQRVSHVYFRRKRSDVLSELPDKTEIEDWCDLNEEEYSTYKSAVINHSFSDARRVSWNVDSQSSTKMQRLKEIVEMAKEDGRKVLVFSFFLDTIDKIYKEFGSKAYGPINGSVSSEQRQKIIDRFDKAQPGSVLVCQIQSGGVGLNIQSASVVVICEPQFKPSTENQAISRSYRMGQSRKVLVYRLLATNTVDERLNKLLSVKQNEFDTFADKSAVAEQSFQIDSKMFAGIMKEEYERITGKKDSEDPLDFIEKGEAEIDVDIKSFKATSQPRNTEKDFVQSPNGGVSVTRRLNMIIQPRGGYLPTSQFKKEQFDDGKSLEKENVSSSLIGIAVDYLTRFMNGVSKEEAFNISLLGARILMKTSEANNLLSKIKNSLDDESIVNSIKLAGFDVAFRAGPSHYVPVENMYPDIQTIENIRIMVNRALKFFESYGPVIKDGFDMKGAYNETISSGDGDYLTRDTLWDFKVSKYEITSKQTLQVLVYYLMGLRSVYPEFKDIKYLGIYNPRLNSVFRYELKGLDESTKKEVERMVIGYKD